MIDNYDFYFLFMLILPKEIIKWIATGMNLCDHLIKVSTELVNTDLLAC